MNLRRLGRPLAAAALVMSALALGVAPAGAGSSAPAVAPAGTIVSNGDGTATVTYSNFTRPLVYFYAKGTTCTDPAGSGNPLPPLFLTGGAQYPLAASPATIRVGTALFGGSTLPAGDYALCLYDNPGTGLYYLVASGSDIPIYATTSSFVENADLTVTLTYSGAKTTPSSGGQFVTLLMLPSVTECPATPGANDSGYVLDSSGFMPASPAVVGVGTNVIVFPPASLTPVPLPAGYYQTCLYQGGTLRQSGKIGAAPVATTASFVENPDNTITLTYANAKKNPADGGEFVNLILWPSITACPAVPDATPGFVLSTSGGGVLMPASPAVIGVGTAVVAYPPTSVATTPLPEGRYQACLYVGSKLAQSGSLGAAPATPVFTG